MSRGATARCHECPSVTACWSRGELPSPHRLSEVCPVFDRAARSDSRLSVSLPSNTWSSARRRGRVDRREHRRRMRSKRQGPWQRRVDSIPPAGVRVSLRSRASTPRSSRQETDRSAKLPKIEWCNRRDKADARRPHSATSRRRSRSQVSPASVRGIHRLTSCRCHCDKLSPDKLPFSV